MRNHDPYEEALQQRIGNPRLHVIVRDDWPNRRRHDARAWSWVEVGLGLGSCVAFGLTWWFA